MLLGRIDLEFFRSSFSGSHLGAAKTVAIRLGTVTSSLALYCQLKERTIKHDSSFDEFDILKNWEFVHATRDVRGLPLVTETGEKVGVIVNVLVDRENEQIVAVNLKDNRACGIDFLEIFDDYVVYHKNGRATSLEIMA